MGKNWSLAGRGGFNSLTVKDVGGFTGVSFGIGFDFKSFAFDYALLPMGDLGLTHRISISFMFEPRPVPAKHTSSRFELEDHDILQDLQENPSLKENLQ